MILPFPKNGNIKTNKLITLVMHIIWLFTPEREISQRWKANDLHMNAPICSKAPHTELVIQFLIKIRVRMIILQKNTIMRQYFCKFWNFLNFDPSKNSIILWKFSFFGLRKCQNLDKMDTFVIFHTQNTKNSNVASITMSLQFYFLRPVI